MHHYVSLNSRSLCTCGRLADEAGRLCIHNNRITNGCTACTYYLKHCSQFVWNTVDGERFGGLNICGFSVIKVFMEILSRCLGHRCSLFSTIKERCLYSQKNFHDTPENHEKHESLAQRIFSHLRYTAQGESRVVNIALARGLYLSQDSHKEHSYKQSDSALSVILYFTLTLWWL